MDQIINQENEVIAMYCDIHKRIAQDIFLDPNGIEFLCQKCKQNMKKYSPYKIVNIEEILNENEIPINLPPLDFNDFFFNYIIDTESNTNLNRFHDFMKIKIKEVDDFFFTLQNKLNDAIEELKQQNKQNFILVQEKFELIYEVYENISSRRKIRDAFLNQKEQNIIKIQVDPIIKEQFKNKYINSKLLSHQIIEFESLYENIQNDLPDQIINNLIDKLNQIAFDEISKKYQSSNKQNKFEEVNNLTSNNDTFLNQVNNFQKEEQNVDKRYHVMNTKISNQAEQKQVFEQNDQILQKPKKIKVLDQTEKYEKVYQPKPIEEQLQNSLEDDLDTRYNIIQQRISQVDRYLERNRHYEKRSKQREDFLDPTEPQCRFQGENFRIFY